MVRILVKNTVRMATQICVGLLRGGKTNLFSFHTMILMTKALNQIEKEGHIIDMEALVDFSPYSQ
jgi:hypothetical protein